MRVVGLDIGDRTIGVAVSDEDQILATGVRVLRRTSEADDVQAVLGLVGQQGAGRIVAGLPRTMNGSIGPQAEKVLGFVAALRRECDLPVDLWDERLSTRAAERAMLEANLSRARRRSIVDQVAATVILQGFLDARRARPVPGSESDGSMETR